MIAAHKFLTRLDVKRSFIHPSPHSQKNVLRADCVTVILGIIDIIAFLTLSIPC